MSDRVDIRRLLLEMHAMKAQTHAFGGVGSLAAKDVVRDQGIKTNGPQFSDLMSQAINKVNEVQQASSAMSQAYIQGAPNSDVTDVMIASQ